MTCRFCGEPLVHTFADLGESPLSNAFIKPENLNKKEYFYPLHAYVCDACYLVQLQEFESPQAIFEDYAYFSSFSESWLRHAQTYTEQMIHGFGVNQQMQVVEIACNDGYLLQYFVKHGIPVLGIEPAKNVALEAEKRGIPIITEFFGENLAAYLVEKGVKADLLIGNNVLAHVPDLNDFVKGLKILLNSNGMITLEFPHLLQLINGNQFDTIYHEHFSYFSLLTIQKVFEHVELEVFHVEEIPTHGGSLRVYVKHSEDTFRMKMNSVTELLQKEMDAGLNAIQTYIRFAKDVRKIKQEIMQFFKGIKEQGCTIVGYGAPAKGNTLLNYCEIGIDTIEYTVDLNPYKQGLYLPGTHIPVYSPERIAEKKPDYIVILPWNLKSEIMEQLAYAKNWGAKFVILIPGIEVF
ncbi:MULTISPECIES: class I SAM-dependent methyltransferase [unclassified Dehalobacter]|uniref:class I SAM-dependent methyltransferase n=1 Tax=unclassified Dehalobacter TaxID=2635733 RepID=UPI00036E53D3|nr:MULTISPECIES: class I SAM-dependent methyltransferase [unclassified Dehalobacter]TCX52103.1 SAM-dependent methyltransferase [Dehalobacter sp. 14DCB1]TCX53167.1 SAM-dependent methyltransferase [Dehalobacter sp. 12DCB1]